MFKKSRREDIIIAILDSLLKKDKKKLVTYLRLIKGGKK